MEIGKIRVEVNSDKKLRRPRLKRHVEVWVQGL
jgi:hypothetical protein